MLIDWFTVIAQALNFLILVWLLRRFAYGPILEAIDTREQRIAAQMASAAAAQAAVLSEREILGRRSAELEEHRSAMLEEATQDAKATRQKLLEQARQDVDAQRERLLSALSAEQEKVGRDLSNRIQQEALQMAGQTLRDLAHLALNEAMVNVFLEHLATLSAADRLLLTAPESGSGGCLIRSAFELSPETRTRILAAMSDQGARVEFETAPDLVCGIELRASGHKLVWSVADYMAGLESRMSHLDAMRDRAEESVAVSVP